MINGAKTWSTSAFAADFGLFLARTDWTVPKHEGLTMFLAPIRSPGVTLRRIQQVDGSNEFCEEFFDGLELDADAVVGEGNKGWHVASSQLYHELSAVGHGSEFASGKGRERSEEALVDFFGLAEATGQSDSERIQEKVGRVLARRMVRERLIDHISRSVQDGSLPPAAGSIIPSGTSRLLAAEVLPTWPGWARDYPTRAIFFEYSRTGRELERLCLAVQK